MTEPKDEADAGETAPAKTLETIANALRGLRYGEVTIIVQDGVVIQLERTERIRLRRGRR